MEYEELLKIKIIAHGIKITNNAKIRLTKNNEIPLSIFTTPTTSGIKLKLNKTNIYINASFADPHYKNSSILLDYKKDNFIIKEGKNTTPVYPISLRKTVLEKNKNGFFYSDLASTQLDRLRIAPVGGCSFSCKFCDISKHKYILHELKDLIEAATKAIKESSMPIKHMLISGGTPATKDYIQFEKTIKEICKNFKMPIDLMVSPIQDITILQRLKSYGINGLSINLEIYNEKIARDIIAQKSLIGRDVYFKFLKEAVKIFGKENVRSLLIVGLEPIESTIKGIEELSKIGVVPVLSPFVPTSNIKIKNTLPPDEKTLLKIWKKAKNITKKYDIKLGPKCIPCQHNTLTFPDKSNFYYYS